MKSAKILKLKPTQFSVGMAEIDFRLHKFQRMKKRELKKSLKYCKIPIVISPDGGLYIVDHHHFALICYLLGYSTVRVKILKDLSGRKMSDTQFWAWMRKNRYYYPYCQFGDGPRPPIYLPRDVRGLADDPYRGLAWLVRESGGFKNTAVSFAEFKWANLFRKSALLDRATAIKVPSKITLAIELSQSIRARNLPGYQKVKSLTKLKRDGKDLARKLIRLIEQKSEN